MSQIVGTTHNDTLTGASGNDTILGQQGNDSITGGSPAENLLVDGSFETAPVGANTWSHYAQVGGWRSDTGVEVWGKDFIVHATDGNNVAELDFDNNFSKVWQDVKTTAGQEYALTLDTAMRPGTSAATNAINIFWNGVQVGRVEPGSVDWAHQHFNVIGSGGTDRLEFREDANQNDSYGGLMDNVRLTAEGTGNKLFGGSGNDTIVAGNHNDLLVGGGDGSAGNVDMTRMKVAEDVTAQVSFDGSGAGYHNVVGMYVYDKSGQITGVKMIYTDISGQGVHGQDNVSVGLSAGDHFGFFVASNARNQAGNAALLDSTTGTFKMVDATDGSAANVNSGHEMKLVFVAADGTMTDVKTQYGTSLFSTNTSDNGDGFRHAHTTVDPLTGKLSVAFEDLQGGGDQNFHDANFSVMIGTTNAVQMAHELGSGHTSAANNDLLIGGTGDDTLVGLSGDDTLHGGLGNNSLFGGSGDDKVIADGGNDKIDGGSGFDTLDLSNATGALKIDLSKHTAEGFGHLTVKSMEGLISGGFADTIKGDKRDNVIDGGAGNDTIRGYIGADTLTGGAGDDKFLWQLKDVVDASGHSLGIDTITDFGNGKDVLDIHKMFSGIKGSHASLVSLVDTTTGTELHATVHGHNLEVAMLTGVHNVTVADLMHAHELLA